MRIMETVQPLIHQIGGHVALDFANTVSWRGEPREIDHIASGAALLGWAKQNGLVEPSVCIEGDADSFVSCGRRLRQAIRGAFEGVLAATETEPAYADLLDIARESLGSAILSGVPANIRYSKVNDAIFGKIAWAAIELLGSDRLRRVKICEPHNCRWLFLDTTKNGTRRWCDMGTCGTRAKVTQHRAQNRGKHRSSE